MELLYLWIDDFRNIKEQGFNFSSEIRFNLKNLNNLKNEKTLEFEIDINPDYIELFDKGILNVTAIIGKNGSGKSTLFHAIKLLYGRLANITSPMCFFILDKRNIRCYYYKGGRSDMKPLEVTVSNFDNSKYKFDKPIPYSIKKNPGKLDEVEGLDGLFDNVNCCFFSNSFDSHREDIYYKVVNVSTNYRVEQFLDKYVKNLDRTYLRRRKEGPTLFHNHIAEYHKGELRTLLKFISYAKNRRTGFIPRIPDSLQIEFSFEDYDYLIHDQNESYLFDVGDLKKIHEVALEIISKERDQRANLYNFILLLAFYYALRWDLFKPNKFSTEDTSGSIRFLAVNSANLFKNIEELFSKMEITDDDNKKQSLKNLFGKPLKEAIQKLSFQNLRTEATNTVRFPLVIKDSLWGFLNIIHEYKHTVETSFVNYIWSGLSTGEEAFLNHFARIYEAKSNCNDDFIWLIIDEGDLYFHAEWQKDYISNLLLFTKFIFPKKNVQIFVSSHSPFIASDLPKSNVVFLKSESGKENGCVVSDIQEHEQTFGNNILALYKDSFFLSDLIGGFAKEKINEVFKWGKGELTKNNYEYYRKLINQIGEPILFTKLTEVYEKKTGISLEENRLLKLQEEIMLRLQSIRKINNDSNQE